MTYDKWVSMRCGPVLSKTYDLTKPNAIPGYWAQHIRKDGNFVRVEAHPGSSLLSRAEKQILRDTYKEWGQRDVWEVVDATHQFPEWHDPGRSSSPIDYETVLMAHGESAKIDALREDLSIARSLAHLTSTN
jgi:hypothetical protein